ncbi:MAG: cupin domain-containing protein [Nanoarchaeota archaeon]
MNNLTIRYRPDIKFLEDTCGKIQELYHSDQLSIAYVIVTGIAKSHIHRRMEEVYYIEKGEGKLYVGKEVHPVEPGNIVAIPKNVFHHLERTSAEPLEVMVVTHPKYDVTDVIEENQK